MHLQDHERELQNYLEEIGREYFRTGRLPSLSIDEAFKLMEFARRLKNEAETQFNQTKPQHFAKQVGRRISKAGGNINLAYYQMQQEHRQTAQPYYDAEQLFSVAHRCFSKAQAIRHKEKAKENSVDSTSI
jgi:hypothetical protein